MKRCCGTMQARFHRQLLTETRLTSWQAWPLTGRSQAREATGNPAVATAKRDVSKKKTTTTTTRGWGGGESKGRFPSLSLALFSSLIFFSLSSSTSFPGFSPARPAERERALSLSLSVGRVGENPANEVFSSFVPHSSIRTPETGPLARRHNCQISANQRITYVNVTSLLM